MNGTEVWIILAICTASGIFICWLLNRAANIIDHTLTKTQKYWAPYASAYKFILRAVAKIISNLCELLSIILKAIWRLLQAIVALVFLIFVIVLVIPIISWPLFLTIFFAVGLALLLFKR